MCVRREGEGVRGTGRDINVEGPVGMVKNQKRSGAEEISIRQWTISSCLRCGTLTLLILDLKRCTSITPRKFVIF